MKLFTYRYSCADESKINRRFVRPAFGTVVPVLPVPVVRLKFEFGVFTFGKIKFENGTEAPLLLLGLSASSNLSSGHPQRNEKENNRSIPSGKRKGEAKKEKNNCEAMTNQSKASTLLAEHESQILQTMSDAHLRVAVVGNVDSGKSTLIGTLTSSTLDNGKGSNRAKVATHKHEAESGRTSSVSTRMLGFDSTGKVISGMTLPGKFDESGLVLKSNRVVSLMDLAGHEKYLRTTIAGLSKGMADYALVLVSASQPPTHMTVKHLNICISLSIPVIVVITKSDACPHHVYQSTRKVVQDTLRSVRSGQHPFDIRKLSDVQTVVDKMHCLAPMVTTSCVSGEGLDLLQSLLFSLPKRRQHLSKVNRPFEFLIEETFLVTGVGLVLSGFVNAGFWNKGDTIFIGPAADGTYIKTTAKSAHVARTSVKRCWAGHSACFAVTLTKEQRKMFNKRKGLVVVHQPVPTSRSFTADIYVMKGQSVTMLTGSYRTTAHILHLKRPVRLLSAQNSTCNELAVLRLGDQLSATFQFTSAEYIRKGMRLILRDGEVHGIGVVTSIEEMHKRFSPDSRSSLKPVVA